MPEPREWSIARRHPFIVTADGPEIPLGHSIVVVPKADYNALAERLREASWALAEIDRWLDTEGFARKAGDTIAAFLANSEGSPDGDG